MACGYAMYTDRLGRLLRDGRPGRLQPLLRPRGRDVGLLSGAGDLGLRLAGVARARARSTRRPGSTARRTRRRCSRRPPRSRSCSTDIAETCDVLEEAVNLAFEGRPGPGPHPRPREPHPSTASTVDNYRDIRARREAGAAGPGAGRRRSPTSLADALVEGQARCVALVGFGAIRSGAGPEVQALHRALPDPLRHHAGRQGHRRREPSAVGRRVLRQRPHQRLRRRSCEADVVLAVGNSFNQHATFDFRDDLFDGQEADPRQHRRRRDRQGLQGRRTRSSPTPSRRSPRCTRALDGQVGPRRRATVERPRLRGASASSTCTGKIHPGQMAQAIVAACCPPNGIVLADAGAHLAWLGYYSSCRTGRTSASPASFGPMAVHVNGAHRREDAPTRTAPSSSAAATAATLLSGFELMTAVEHDIPVIWVIFNDGEFKLIKLYQLLDLRRDRPGRVREPRLRGLRPGLRRRRLPGRDARGVRGTPSRRRSRSGRPAVIDAQITRWALPHYSPSPEGVLAGHRRD